MRNLNNLLKRGKRFNNYTIQDITLIYKSIKFYFYNYYAYGYELGNVRILLIKPRVNAVFITNPSYVPHYPQVTVLKSSSVSLHLFG